MTKDKHDQVQDAIENSWVNEAPEWLRPFLQLSRFDRPVGAWLLFLPCCFGAFLAGTIAKAPTADVVHLVFVCFIGAWLMRGAGCTWNDIVDRKIDAQVERTRSRPLPSGRVNVTQALIWLAVQALIALVALLTLEPKTILTAIASLGIVAFYPFAKRLTYWPQIVLGLAMNWGIFVAWVEITGEISPLAIVLYASFVFWTLFYDTIYAFQDIADDEVAGVKSSAQAVKNNPEAWLERFLALMWGAMFVALLMAKIESPIIWLVGIFFLIDLEHMRRQFDAGDRGKCLLQFRANTRSGQYLALGWAFGYLLALA